MKIVTNDEEVTRKTPKATIQPIRPNRELCVIPTKDEADDVSDCFKKLNLNPANFTNKQCKPVLNVQVNWNDSNRINSDSDSNSTSSSEDDSDDDQLRPKCPDKANQVKKKTKQSRQQSAPYHGTFLNKYHDSGGSLVLDGYSFCRKFDCQKPLCIPQSNNGTNLGSSDQHISTEEVLSTVMKANLTPQEQGLLQDAISTLLNEIENTETNIPETETYNSRTDDDSAYETSSPHSSATFSPMQNSRFSDTEVSPTHEIETSYNIIAQDFEPRTVNLFKTPSPVNNRDRTLPLNIPMNTTTALYKPPVDRYLPVRRLRSLPTSPTPQRRHCPDIAVTDETAVYEEKMIQPGADRLKLRLNRNHLEVEWIRVLLDADFCHQRNKNNETKLMEHLRNKANPRYFEILHAILQKIKQAKYLDLLLYSNKDGHSALSIAVYELYTEPIIARCITDTLTELGHIVDQVDSNGNSLLHNLAAGGDNYVHVLAELLNSKSKDGNLCFNVNKQNRLFETPLHIATKSHSSTLLTLSICKVLLRHDADVSIQDRQGLTPIHLAVGNSCHPQLIKSLLSSDLTSRATTKTDNAGNTALHYAASRNDLSPNHQMKVICQLINCGWSLKACNMENKTPIVCITEDRRKVFKNYVSWK